MAELRAVPAPKCPRWYNGHHCTRDRGHRGCHECTCGQTYSDINTNRVPFHGLDAIFPESSAA